jgi:hypothetical protein
MEGSCSTGQSPQWAVVPVEEEEKCPLILCSKRRLSFFYSSIAYPITMLLYTEYF